MQINSGGQGVQTPSPLKNHKNIGFLSNTGPDTEKSHSKLPGREAQSVTCLATDACLTADPGVAN